MKNFLDQQYGLDEEDLKDIKKGDIGQYNYVEQSNMDPMYQESNPLGFQYYDALNGMGVNDTTAPVARPSDLVKPPEAPGTEEKIQKTKEMMSRYKAARGGEPTPKPEAAPEGEATASKTSPVDLSIKDDGLDAALENANRSQLIQSLASNAGRIGTAIAGGGVDTLKFDETPYQDISKIGAQGVSDIKAKREKEQFNIGLRKSKLDEAETLRQEQYFQSLNDPNSKNSQLARSLAKKFAPDLDTTGMTGSDLMKQLPMLANVMTAEENRKARLEAARMNAESLKLRREEMMMNKQNDLTAKQNVQLDKDVDKLATKIQKSGVYSAAEALNNIENTLGAMGASLDNPEKAGDLPGVGAFDSLKPSFLVSDNGSKLRMNIQSLANTLLKERSGAAVSDQEYKRFLQELTDGKFGSEKELLSGLQKMRNDYRNIAKTIETGNAKTMQAFKERSGMPLPSEMIDAPKQKQKKDPQTEAALKWIEANPNDPRVPAIKQKLGL